MEWLAIIITILIFVLSLAIKHSKERRRLSAIFPDISNSEPHFKVIVRNPGPTAVKINAPEIKLPDGNCAICLKRGDSIVHFPSRVVYYPFSLEGEDEIPYHIQKEKFARRLLKKGYSGNVKLSVEITDFSGKTYRSKKPLEFNLDDVLKSGPQKGELKGE